MKECNAMNPDPAAVFAAAHSLWEAAHKAQRDDPSLNLGAAYSGFDGFMRVLMQAGTRFEEWCCSHVAFEAFESVWPYCVHEQFGEACLARLDVRRLGEFETDDCLAVALTMRLPVRVDGKLPVPVFVTAANPVPGSAFDRYRISSHRTHADTGDAVPFGPDDDPLDEGFGRLFYRLSGLSPGDACEPISDRDTFAEALGLARRIAPGISFPETVTTETR
jgi:hypothetical protein